MQGDFFNGRLIVKTGDITAENTDAIVNAANWTLLGGGGVDGAIHQKGGKEIYDACKRIRETTFPDGLPTGRAVITTGGNLPARCVIHTVGPIYGQNGGSDAEMLAESYRNSIRLAIAEGLGSIAFPSISTGAFAFPKHEAARIAARTIAAELRTAPDNFKIHLVFHTDSDALTFLKHSDL